MFQRAWFHVDAASEALAFEIAAVVQRYATVRVTVSCGREQMSQPERFAGVVLAADDAQARALSLRARYPGLPVLALAAHVAGLNALQAAGVEVALLPVGAPSLVAFVQRALAAHFVSNARVSRLVRELAVTRTLTTREVQILAYALGDEPRARVRRRLGITENTLKTEVRGLLRKTAARNVDALAKNVLRAALLAPDGNDRNGMPWLVARRAPAPSVAPLARAQEGAREVSRLSSLAPRSVGQASV